MRVKKAVIPAAGLGTRMFPLSLACPKEMLPLGRKPALHYVVQEAADAGIETLVLITAASKTSITRYFFEPHIIEGELQPGVATECLDEIRRLTDQVDIVVIHQKGAMGLGHAIHSATPVVGEDPFVIMLPDDIIFPAVTQSLVGLAQACGTGALCVREVEPAEVSRYGIVSFEAAGEHLVVTGAVEKPQLEVAPSHMAILGRYVMPEGSMSRLLEFHGPRGEIQLTACLDSFARNEGLVALAVDAARHLDLGSMEGYLEANFRMALADPGMSSRTDRFLKRD